MGRKHKHEEHVNHERWLVSFADMMTLLFALFVVLYAMGVTKLAKVDELKKSIQFAFHIAGEGKTKDQGIFDQQGGAGDMPAPAPLLTAQQGEMKEFLTETLPQDFQEVSGRSLEVNMMDDTVQFTAPLESFFAAGTAYPVKPEVYAWLSRAVVGSLTFTAGIRIRIETPHELIGQDRDGRRETSLDLCVRRLFTLRKAITNHPEVRPWMVDIELAEMPDQPRPGQPRIWSDWEKRATVTLAFSNVARKHR